MFYSSQSSLWYKGSFISFVEESKYIWLQDIQPDSSSLSFFYTEVQRWQNWTEAPTLSFLNPGTLTRSLLILFSLAIENKVSRRFLETVLDDPTPKPRTGPFPSWLDNKGGISGSVFEYRKFIFSTLLSRNGFPCVHRRFCQHTWLDTSSDKLINKFTVISYQLLNETVGHWKKKKLKRQCY